MHPHFFGLALWLPLSATVLEIPDQFLLFRVHRDDWLASLLEVLHLRIDELKLSISVWVGSALPRLAVGLQAVPMVVWMLYRMIWHL
jgi:hypothetical protein